MKRKKKAKTDLGNIFVENDACVVCGHALEDHIEEEDGWRCHSIGQDGHQCECFLRKERTQGKGIEYYDLESRVKKYLNDVKTSLENGENPKDEIKDMNGEG